MTFKQIEKILLKDGGYSVEIPDLLGCVTQGDNLEEAMEMAQDAALEWILTVIEEEEEIPMHHQLNK